MKDERKENGCMKSKLKDDGVNLPRRRYSRPLNFGHSRMKFFMEEIGARPWKSRLHVLSFLW